MEGRAIWTRRGKSDGWESECSLSSLLDCWLATGAIVMLPQAQLLLRRRWELLPTLPIILIDFYRITLTSIPDTLLFSTHILRVILVASCRETSGRLFSDVGLDTRSISMTTYCGFIVYQVHNHWSARRYPILSSFDFCNRCCQYKNDLRKASFKVSEVLGHREMEYGNVATGHLLFRNLLLSTSRPDNKSTQSTQGTTKSTSS
jgi:hypothetical protein